MIILIKKPTDELLNSLNNTDNIDTFFKENNEFMIDKRLQEYLNTLVTKKSLKKSEILKNAEINDIYGYQIFSGVRKPSRDKLVCICIGMKLSLEETQSVLKLGGFAPLYPKNKRDCIIIFGIKNNQSVCEINNILYEKSEKIFE